MTNNTTNTILTLSDDAILELTASVNNWSDDQLRIIGDRCNERLARQGGEWTIVRGPRSATARFQYQCNRCGGTGRWRIPGTYCGVCYSCDGSKFRNAKISLSAIVRDESQRIKNERAGEGRFTHKELREAAAADLKLVERKTRLANAGIDLDRLNAADEWYLQHCVEVHYSGEYNDVENENENFNKEFHSLTNRLHHIANDIASKAWRFDLSEKQGALVMKYVETCEDAPQLIAKRRAEAPDVLEGRVEITGTIFWLKAYDGNYGTVTKIGVKTDTEAVYFGTRASSISSAEKGDTVTFTATVTKTEPGKGKFSRPSKASLIANTEEGAANA